MIKKLAVASFVSRHLAIVSAVAICATVFFGASASALSVDQIQKKYNLNNQDAKQLIADVRDDVQQQCNGRTDNEMPRCISAKTGPVLQQHASQCINNKKLDEGCSQQLTKQNNGPNQGGGGGGTLSSSGCDASNGTCGHQCGVDGQNPYTPSVDLGCKGIGNPILDTLFGIIRFLSNGVGIVVIGSIIVGGIQYTGSRGDPQATALAVNRIRSSVFALVIFLFAYAAINYIIPGFAL